MEKMRIETTKKGLPAMWEVGGGYTNTGSATIIADSKGKPKKAIYIRGRGHLACAEHALVVVEKGDYIIRANHHRHDFYISVSQISNFEKQIIKEYARGDYITTLSKEDFEREYGSFAKLPFAEIPRDYVTRVAGDKFAQETIEEELYAKKGVWKHAYKLYKVKTEEKILHYAIVKEVNKFEMGEWDTEVPGFLVAAIEAAKKKATCYHCREPHFITE